MPLSRWRRTVKKQRSRAQGIGAWAGGRDAGEAGEAGEDDGVRTTRRPRSRAPTASAVVRRSDPIAAACGRALRRQRSGARWDCWPREWCQGGATASLLAPDGGGENWSLPPVMQIHAMRGTCNTKIARWLVGLYSGYSPVRLCPANRPAPRHSSPLETDQSHPPPRANVLRLHLPKHCLAAAITTPTSPRHPVPHARHPLEPRFRRPRSPPPCPPNPLSPPSRPPSPTPSLSPLFLPSSLSLHSLLPNHHGGVCRVGPSGRRPPAPTSAVVRPPPCPRGAAAHGGAGARAGGPTVGCRSV